MKDTALAKLLADLESFSNLAPTQAKALLLASTYKIGVETPKPTDKTLPPGITRITRGKSNLSNKDLETMKGVLQRLAKGEEP